MKKDQQKRFWKNLLIMLGISVVVIVLSFLSLNLFTRHSQSFIVPDFTGFTAEELQTFSDKYEFQFIVRDSIFVKDKQAGSVIRQDPYIGSTVKKGRKFYLTIVASTPEQVILPSLIDISLRQTTSILTALGMIIGSINYVSDGLTNNLVLAAYNKGRQLKAGDKLEKGSTIVLRVSRQSSREIESDQELQIEDDI